ncbi:hypothetical protein INS90_10195 [Trueperella pecoris]|uniref:Uncharacterized protein n=1 Tax=Trueperella pecoris TaxID=2733571 RepID=A0A7M1R010_9ACTO|nr:hypothetical protein [Trueperella pecoris]QOR47599.1 hypothetical protein INS90_10195 [Trueperella pecoris]
MELTPFDAAWEYLKTIADACDSDNTLDHIADRAGLDVDDVIDQVRTIVACDLPKTAARIEVVLNRNQFEALTMQLDRLAPHTINI